MFNKLKELLFKNEDNHNLGCPQCQGLCGNYQSVIDALSATAKDVSAISDGSIDDEKSLSQQEETVSDGAIQSENPIKAKKYHDDASQDSSWNWLYMRHKSIIQRCKLSDYIDKEISVCEDWLEYENFKSWALSNGCDKDLDLCRNDSNGSFSPENCCWKSRVRILDFLELSGTVKEWSLLTGIRESVIIRRLKDGCSVTSALSSYQTSLIYRMQSNYLKAHKHDEAMKNT